MDRNRNVGRVKTEVIPLENRESDERLVRKTKSCVVDQAHTYDATDCLKFKEQYEGLTAGFMVLFVKSPKRIWPCSHLQVYCENCPLCSNRSRPGW